MQKTALFFAIFLGQEFLGMISKIFDVSKNENGVSESNFLYLS